MTWARSWMRSHHLTGTTATICAGRHHLRWHDDNGHSHVRAALIGPSLTVPFVDKRLTLGTWQQIVFLDLDTSSRSRQLVLQILGE